MKFLYNITTKVDKSVVEKWHAYMLEYHIPTTMETEYFDSYKMMKIVGDDDDDGVTFAIQFVAHSLESFYKYQEELLPDLQNETRLIFQDKCLSFKTLMEIHSES